MAEGRRSGRFAPGQSGNPAGRPPRKPPEGALDAVLAGIGRAGGEGLAVDIARVLAGKRVVAPAAGGPAGETGWKRLLRKAPDSMLDALEALPVEQLEALALSLGGDPADVGGEADPAYES